MPFGQWLEVSIAHIACQGFPLLIRTSYARDAAVASLPGIVAFHIPLTRLRPAYNMFLRSQTAVAPNPRLGRGPGDRLLGGISPVASRGSLSTRTRQPTSAATEGPHPRGRG